MTKRLLPLTIGATILGLVLGGAPAHAQATRTWVSAASGDDDNSCARSDPCKTFAGAIKKTAPGGYIGVIDAGGFGPVIIDKAITIDGGDAAIASILQTGGSGFGIQVDAGPLDRVTIRNLSILGGGAAKARSGIAFRRGGALHVENCIFSDFTNYGVIFGGEDRPGATLEYSLHVGNTLFTNNGFQNNTASPFGGGIIIEPQTAQTLARLHVHVDRVRVEESLSGITVNGSNTTASSSINVIVQRTAVVRNGPGPAFAFSSPGGNALVGAVLDGVTAADNSGAGVQADGANARVSLGNSIIVLNRGGGVSISNGATVGSYKNNSIAANTPDGPLPLTPVPQN